MTAKLVKIEGKKLEAGQLFAMGSNLDLCYKVVNVLYTDTKFAIHPDTFQTTNTLYNIPHYVFIQQKPKLVDISRFAFMFGKQNKEWIVSSDTEIKIVPSINLKYSYIVTIDDELSFSISFDGCKRLQQEIEKLLKE